MIDHPATRTGERHARDGCGWRPACSRPDGGLSGCPGEPRSERPRGLSRGLSPDSAGSAMASEGSAVYIDSIQSLGVKPVVTDWPNFGPLLRIRRYRPVFTFWNVSSVLVVNT